MSEIEVYYVEKFNEDGTYRSKSVKFKNVSMVVFKGVIRISCLPDSLPKNIKNGG